jgi:hypothetical protein
LAPRSSLVFLVPTDDAEPDQEHGHGRYPLAIGVYAMQFPLSRRLVLGGAGAAMALGVARDSPAGEATADLFAFRACGTGNIVFAVVAPAILLPPGPAAVTFHAEPRSWVADLSGASGSRFLTGNVGGWMAIVLETPRDFVASGQSLDVWAEIHTHGRGRTRIGNPFLAKILAHNPMLSQLYHASSPAQDRALFTDPLIERIVVTSRVANPDLHARRLADMLLPDVLTYRPDQPTGYTFARQNGRHPADETAAVVETILTGTPVLRPAVSSVPLTDTFPYFPGLACPRRLAFS